MHENYIGTLSGHKMRISKELGRRMTDFYNHCSIYTLIRAATYDLRPRLSKYPRALIARHTATMLVDTRIIITRKKIDDAYIPVLFVELDNGQNGTLTPYPGKGFGETWLGADGITITLENGIIKATRGMRKDVMGSKSSMPPWSEINDTLKYSRQIYLVHNQIQSNIYSCRKTNNKRSTVII